MVPMLLVAWALKTIAELEDVLAQRGWLDIHLEIEIRILRRARHQLGHIRALEGEILHKLTNDAHLDLRRGRSSRLYGHGLRSPDLADEQTAG